MTKIEQQRQDFISLIKTDDWTQYTSSQRSSYYSCSRAAMAFDLYHKVMMDRATLNYEDFTKKYWLLIYKNTSPFITETKINNQNAKFYIDWESCAIRITESVVDTLKRRLDILEGR